MTNYIREFRAKWKCESMRLLECLRFSIVAVVVCDTFFTCRCPARKHAEENLCDVIDVYCTEIQAKKRAEIDSNNDF